MIEVGTNEKEESVPLKYQNYIVEVKSCSCPPENATTKEREGFRYIFETDPENNSHKPPKLKNPKRIMESDEDNCSLCALSCFITKEHAIDNYMKLISARPNLLKILGDSLALANLDDNSGLQTEEDEQGHFDLFEFETFNPSETFMFLHKIEIQNGTN